MKILIKIFLLTNLLLTNFVYAQENQKIKTIDLNSERNNQTIDIYNNTLYFKTENGIDEFMIMENGSIMMKIDGIYEEVAYVDDSSAQQHTLKDPISLYIAPSQFLLSTTKQGIQVRINANVISMGITAIQETLIAIVSSKVTSEKINITSLSISIAANLAIYIYNNYEVYEVNCTRKSYVYNGCTWLIYDEICFPDGYDVGGYIWLDNPGLGVAPATCKLASQTYPY